MMHKNNLIFIGGPTAVGKTSIAIKLAKHFSTEIVSCDSRQFYKEMKIGTAIPSNHMLNEIKHHFIQDRSVLDHLSVGQYEKEALFILDTLFKKNKNIIMVGGSGLYASSVLYGLDSFPNVSIKTKNLISKLYEDNGLNYIKNLLKKRDIEYYEKVDLNNHRRIIRALEICFETKLSYSSFLLNKQKKRNFEINIFIIDKKREILYDKIDQRVDQMINNGLENEAKSLIEFKDLNALQTVGYKEWFSYWNGQSSEKKVIDDIKRNTRRYAKRQLTWFKKYEKAKWIYEKDPINEILKYYR
tara:strand:- start:134 stop:1033 length:900 start_codon:yes stop_codon:yes gene_type:complete